ncbi:MAG TPA: hypothetical protein PKM12_02760, partial [Marmoricola sp.]|nr:hypothetical protein [Marmoricola sp.]
MSEAIVLALQAGDVQTGEWSRRLTAASTIRLGVGQAPVWGRLRGIRTTGGLAGAGAGTVTTGGATAMTGWVVSQPTSDP